MSISVTQGDLHSISESQFPYLSNGVLIHLFLGLLRVLSCTPKSAEVVGQLGSCI